MGYTRVSVLISNPLQVIPEEGFKIRTETVITHKPRRKNVGLNYTLAIYIFFNIKTLYKVILHSLIS